MASRPTYVNVSPPEDEVTDQSDHVEEESRPTVQINEHVPENTSKHHTEEYENTALVLRRGDTFKLALTFSGIEFAAVLKTIIRISVDFNAEKAKMFSKSCKAETSLDDSKWSMMIVEKDKAQLKIVVNINIPVDVMVGRYHLEIIAPSSIDALKNIPIIVLFNPWNKKDEVYLEDDELKKEYVLNDSGIVYQGNYIRPRPKMWNFGQFEENVLDCVLLLLNKYHDKKNIPAKTLMRYANPVWISRWLSAVLNQQNEGGLLVGNWSGNFDGGEVPWYWSGSVEIFETYYKERKPVKYAQCWVFSGVLTTALRALGIPARSVTNYESAHDTDGTMTIDMFYDEENERLEDECIDSVWNFHVWNEAWIKRKDLPGDRYDGWQAVDATPQEESARKFQMGPAPLNAVKEGEIYAGFDTGFVYAEVNATRVKWIVTKDNYGRINVTKMGKTHSDSIGRKISTKTVGNNQRNDITHLYKYDEGSEEEKKSFNTAYSFGKGPENYPNLLNHEEEGQDLTIDIATSDSIESGDAFSCISDVKNTSSQNITVDVTMVIHSTKYTGKPMHFVKNVKHPGIAIETGKSAKQELKVSPKEYLEKLTDMQSFKVVALIKVHETNKRYVDDHSFYLSDKSSVKVELQDSSLQVGKETTVQVTFTNPLPITLYGLSITIEGAGLVAPMKKTVSSFSDKSYVFAGETVTTEFTFVPKKAGERTLQTTVSTRLPNNFTCNTDVKVLPK